MGVFQTSDTAPLSSFWFLPSLKSSMSSLNSHVWWPQWRPLVQQTFLRSKPIYTSVHWTPLPEDLGDISAWALDFSPTSGPLPVSPVAGSMLTVPLVVQSRILGVIPDCFLEASALSSKLYWWFLIYVIWADLFLFISTSPSWYKPPSSLTSAGFLASSFALFSTGSDTAVFLKQT